MVPLGFLQVALGDPPVALRLTFRTPLSFPNRVRSATNELGAQCRRHQGEFHAAKGLRKPRCTAERRVLQRVPTVTGDQAERDVQPREQGREGRDQPIAELHVQEREVGSKAIDNRGTAGRTVYRSNYLATQALNAFGQVQGDNAIILGDKHPQTAQI